MKKVFLVVLISIISLMSLSAQSTYAAASQVTLKVKKIYAGSAVKFITSSRSVWEYDSIQAHQVSGLSNIVALSEGDSIYGTFALDSGGSVWHYNNYFKSSKLSAYKGITAIAQYYDNVYALDGKGNLHVGSANSHASPDRIVQKNVKFMSTNSNADLILVVYSDGSVGKSEKYKWSKIAGLKNIVSVYAGFLSSFALDDQGTVWAWGSNADGDLGDGTTIDRSSPVKVKGLPKIVAISGSKALAQDGTVWAWGSNANGELGDGSPATPPVYEKISNSYDSLNPWYFPYKEVSRTPHSVPVQVKGLTNIVQIANSFALDKQGIVWGWGDNRGRVVQNSEWTAVTEPQQLNLTVDLTYPGAWTYKDNGKYSAGVHNIVLSDGRIFVHGYNGSFLYNPRTGKVISKPDFKLTDGSNEIYSLSDGTVLFKYGSDMTRKTFKIMNPDTWSLQALGISFDDVQSIIPLSKERILFLGTRKSTENVYNHAMIYDLKLKKWTALPDMKEHRIRPVAAELPDGNIVVAGGDTLAGSSLEILHVEDRKWVSYDTDFPEPNDINRGTIEVIPIDSEHVVIVAGLRLYTFDVANNLVKEYSTPRRVNYLVSHLKDSQLLLLGESEAYTFDAVTGKYSAFKHPGTMLSIYDLLFKQPNGTLMYFGYGGEFTLKSL
ncbi:hypothetical protein PCCS19_36660 [Paenibacillus sp. CCS19]|uniref:hypothetical protein n=1 Tax=Paenibacillus sp. CCS19 TaxID=3158387 RepID=UPI00256018B2|nr:hypothetical protein [Paenibacillus cellulosilyticus]GMK40610.1 hypothetical protein PCCS19_36660 [Paenibacillus cellulosilyticus]